MMLRIQEVQSDNHIENKIEEILDTVRENYLNGELNSEEAFDLFYQMAEMGNAEAMTTVAFMFSVGEGIEENINEAMYWYGQAAELEYSDTICNLGFLYIYKTEIIVDKIIDKKDHSDISEKILKKIATRIITKKGLNFFKKAVELGNTQAMCLLAECYLNGRGVKKDRDTAFEYYEQAANLGNQGAMMALGMMTLNEDDKHFDREKSQELFRKARGCW